MRMTASWSGRYGPTEYKVVARYFAPDGKLPLGLLCCPTKKITGARSKSALTENAPYKACSAFTRVAACTLALSPMRDTLIEGFSHFVSSMTAPIASGWSGCRVGLAPTGKRRLVTAHTHVRHWRIAFVVMHNRARLRGRKAAATDKLLVDNPVDLYKIRTDTKGSETAPDG